MGLSAAQARLLTITARKSDCEFQSMTLSHQKIALSRNMERLSNEYQNSLNQTKLVYDYYGTNQSNLALDYGLLMTPSIYNDYYPKLVTDAKNRVVLNSAYAAAARAAGIPAEGLCGTPDTSVRNAFIEALAGENIITPTKAATIQATSYGNQIGLGSTVKVNASTTDMNYEEFLDLVMAKTENSLSWGLTLGQDGVYKPNTDDLQAAEALVIYNSAGTRSSVATGKSASGQSITLYDLLSGENNYNISLHSRKGEKVPLAIGSYLQEKMVGEDENSASFLNWLTDQFQNVLGGTNENNLALQYAYNQVYNLLYPSDTLQDLRSQESGRLYTDGKSDLKEWCNSRQGSRFKDALDQIGIGTKINKSDGYHESVDRDAINTLGITYTYDYDHAGFHADRNDKSQVSINLNNVAKVFLTAFVEFQEGVENSTYDYSMGSLNNKKLFDPNRDDFTFTVSAGTDVDTGDEALDVYFYDALFNMICTSGWTENDQINDAEYMQEMLKSGMVYISSIRDDGFYYQGNYATDSYIREVTDDEAVARAQAKYNTEKAKIQNKEDTIDLKMKNLDTEISALTQEYDTTKSVISKSIEKSFKRYDA